MSLDQLAVNQRRVRGLSLESLVVDRVKPEARPETLDPFEIIQKRPVVVTADIDPAMNRGRDLVDMLQEVARAKRIVLISDAVFGDEDRKLISRRFPDLGACERARELRARREGEGVWV